MIAEKLLDILKLCFEKLNESQLHQMVQILLSIHEEHKPVENWDKDLLSTLNSMENKEIENGRNQN
ncbi:MAG: hypothetical protein J6Y85_01720 [Alphaproteobacteria bacterium]|nr:hypothetical protein [Alphaproteobacteria bacterium]